MNRIATYTMSSVIAMMLGFHSSVTWAGNALEDHCTQTYNAGVLITGFNASTEASGAYGINVRFSNAPNNWYFISLKQTDYLNRDVIFETIKLAYVSGEKVNACYGNGFLTGVELRTE